MKIGKLLKSMKIIKKNESVPGWVDTLILFIVAIFVIGILGTIINKKSKSLVQGFTFWFDLTKEQFQIKTANVLITIGVIAIAAVFLALSNRLTPAIQPPKRCHDQS
jgi:K+-sensing histidine kinase KdpD